MTVKKKPDDYTPLSGKRYVDFQTTVLKQLPGLDELTWSQVEQICNDPKKLNDDLRKVFKTKSWINTGDTFELISAQQLQVPDNYTHSGQLNNFIMAHEIDFFNDESDNLIQLEKSTEYQLWPQQIFTAMLWRITKPFTAIDECPELYRVNNLICGGVQGMSLTYSLKKDFFPKKSRIICCDYVMTAKQPEDSRIVLLRRKLDSDCFYSEEYDTTGTEGSGSLLFAIRISEEYRTFY
jgi:hypothetical protein